MEVPQELIENMNQLDRIDFFTRIHRLEEQRPSINLVIPLLYFIINLIALGLGFLFLSFIALCIVWIILINETICYFTRSKKLSKKIKYIESQYFQVDYKTKGRIKK